MEIRFFADVDAFAAAAGPYLGMHEAENNLPIGILAAIQAGQYSSRTALLVSLEEGGELVAVALRTPPHNLVLSFGVPIEAVDHLALALQEREETLPGVIADVATAMAFTHAWARLGGVQFELGVSERIYRLDAVRASTGSGGAMRTATEDDLALALLWMESFALDTGRGGKADLAEDARWFIPEHPGFRGLVFWEVGGQPVSMAGYTGPTPHGIRVSAVYTPPEFRGRGYASACVAALSQRLLDDGREFCFLFTDLANPTSNHIYQEIGYEVVCDVSAYSTPDEP